MAHRNKRKSINQSNLRDCIIISICKLKTKVNSQNFIGGARG